MGILFTTGTINQPDSGSVGTAMAEKIRDDLVAHPAWDLVEEFTAASGAVRWYVFKCLASESGLESDFYVVIGRTLANGTLRAFICEGYSARIAQFYTPVPYYTNYAMDEFGRSTKQFSLGGAQLSGAQDQPGYHEWVPSGTSTKWWLTVDNDGFTVAFNGASNGYWHFGVYTVLSQLPNLMPLHSYGTGWGGAGQTGHGSITRNPAIANITWLAGALTFTYATNLGFVGDLRYNDKLQNNNRPVAELGMNVTQNQVDHPVTNGWALGKMKRMRVGANPPAGVAFGDAYVLSNRLWVPSNPTSGLLFDTGVPSS